MAILSQGALIFALFACMLIKILSYENLTAEETKELLGFNTLQAPFFVLCFIALSYMLVLMCVYLYKLHQAVTLAFMLNRKKYEDGTQKREYSSMGLLVGAISLGLVGGLMGGLLFGVSGGCVGGVVFGLMGSIMGEVCTTQLMRLLHLDAAHKKVKPTSTVSA